ncbi:P-loop containing nucleoside triphosphate hydrolase protein [Dioscorea alata]|uniref:P-loop containing nucleoside triphosphate hydrolase protein n=1 Tax=Dioscorea alata TaxID=55571 RepID=A0ACB7VXC6_DIOAL|nr:P-loop containing nucleoside triphosphate hydrolase protein [Dioscorea alata]
MAMLVDVFAGKLVERLTNVIEEKAIMVLGVKNELQRLQRRMERIARVLKDAEKRRIQDETVKGWVDELKDLMYNADDIIDLCMIEGLELLHDDDHSSTESSSTASIRVRCNFPLLSCVRSVPFRYEIADKIKSLNDKLNEISEDKDKFNFILSSKSNVEHVMNEASYRQSSSLLEPDIVGWDIRDATKSLVELLVSQHEPKCYIFAIVGMGGIGKTTVAQQIYNDSKINDAFVLRSWIWVSKSFTSRTDLLKEIIRNTGGTYGESTTIAELQNILCDVLNGKSLFLVLDDVWDANTWNDLIKNSVGGTTTKCRVLVTTRDRNTGVKMGAMHIHNVNKLPLDVGWELLCKRVFTNNNKRDIQRMKDIGMKIVEKCDGLPIAIKTIAGVLVTKDQNKREWESVLNSDAWTITGLPEELQGALYLSYEALPSALKHCFLYCSLNALGREFFHEDLICQWIAKGFIEANMMICTMHDTLRALAEFLAGDENFSGDPQEVQSSKSMKKLRRLNIVSNRECVSIPHPYSLRRLCLFMSPPSLNTQVIGNLKHLCLLILNGGKIENIPDSIGDLVHLRLLDLERTSISKLPDSLGNLVNLQFLLLRICKSLYILPKSITKLHSLRWLDLFGVPLNYVPKGIGKLEHLHHVLGFIVGDGGDDGEEGCNLEEIQMLEKLSYLMIDKLEKMDNIMQVFDALCPPSGLEQLAICDYFGGQYPKWMTSSSINTVLPKLTSLQLFNCSNCPQLPQLGQLAQLKYLKIEGATAVVSISPKFLGNNGEPSEIAFPKLEYLLGEEDNESESSKPLKFFPHLKRISIAYCPKLKAIPRGLNQSNIQELSIIGAHSLSRISHLPTLKVLKVIDCPVLECVEKLESLQSLKLTNDHQSNISLPYAQALHDCLRGHRYWSSLQQVPRFIGYGENQRMYLKYTKEPYYYETNTPVYNNLMVSI